MARRPPSWTSDEWIVALDLYLRHKGKVPSLTSPEIKSLSENLRAVQDKIIQTLEPKTQKAARNPKGVHTQINKFAGLDPNNKNKGLGKPAEFCKIVWDNFNDKPAEVRALAQAILKETRAKEVVGDIALPEPMNFALEGKLLSRKHWRRERNTTLVLKKKQVFLEKYKDIFCEVCDFNYRKHYGERGAGYIECHHTRPLSCGTRQTKLEDLILICASCHRIIHRKSPWLEVAALESLVQNAPYK